jgi:hypothetical protein
VLNGAQPGGQKADAPFSESVLSDSNGLRYVKLYHFFSIFKVLG